MFHDAPRFATKNRKLAESIVRKRQEEDWYDGSYWRVVEVEEIKE